MATQTSERNPFYAQHARAVLEDLAHCKAIDAYQDGDGGWFCRNDQVELVERGGHFEHQPATIRRLRNATFDGRWPR